MKINRLKLGLAAAGLMTFVLSFAGQPDSPDQVPGRRPWNNPVLKGAYADPEILYSRKTGKYYIYPTSDGFDHWSGYYFKVFSSPDLANWTDEGIILDLKKDVPWAGRNAWAPCIEEKEINGQFRYFYYYTGAQKIGVAIADHPTGPFRDIGKPLIDFKPDGVNGGQEIDPDVFTDPKSGKSYLYWGNGYLAVAELNEDMVSIKKETTRVITPDRTFREGAYVVYRKGTYYFMWSEDDTRSPDYRVRYGMSDSPLGPIRVPADNLVLAKDFTKGIYGTGHHSVLQVPGTDEWYIVYHRFRYPDGIQLGDAAGYNREVCIDRLRFDDQGHILPVEPTQVNPQAVPAQPGFGRSERINDGWLFTLSDVKNGADTALDDRSWQRVRLPHDWSAKGQLSPNLASATGYLPGGIGWYRKKLTVPPGKPGEKTYLYFEGVYNRSEVFVNGHSLGYRPNGYVSFGYDATPYIRYGQENTIAVRVDHSQHADSRWYTGSGIYRDVWLVRTNPVHLAQWGVYAYPEIQGKAGVLHVEVELANESAVNARLSVSNELIAPDGTVVAKKTTLVDVGAGSETKSQWSLTVSEPRLWDLTNPVLYQLKTTVMQDGTEIDRSVIRTGFRSFTFDANNGFALNGQGMKVKGVCIHHDSGVLGAEVYTEVWRRRLLTLKSLGCNAIRTSHNPQATALYDLCDELGLLVLNEAFDEWEFSKRKWLEGWNVGTPGFQGSFDFFKEWGQRDLADMVRRDRNHVSVFAWSIGNEVDYPNDPYSHPVLDGGGNRGFTQAQFGGYKKDAPDANRLGDIAKRLVAVVKQYDKSRPVTAGLAGVAMSNETEYPGALDIAGYNYTESRYESDHERYPDRVIYGSENRHDLAAWKAVTANEHIFGQFLWTGIDYLGESGRWPSRGFYSGLLDFAGFVKPRGYFRQSLWSDTPMAYLGTYPAPDRHRAREGTGGSVLDATEASPRNEERPPSIDAWSTWNYDEGQLIRVVCYTNAAKVRLELNGSPVGPVKQYDNQHGIVYWDIPFTPGVLQAVGMDNDDREICRYAIRTSKPAHALRVVSVDSSSAVDGGVAQVVLQVVDEDGVPVVVSEDEVTCEVSGPATLLGLEAGNNTDTTAYTSPKRRVFRGRLIAYVRHDGRAREAIKVRFAAQGLKPTEVRVQSGVGSVATAQRDSAYLFVYFTGNDRSGEAVRFAISDDGFNYRALNGNHPVLDSEKISSTGGVRDPHILRGQDGKTFYMVLTDMVSAKGWDSNRALVLLKSTDLIHWTSTVVNIQQTYPDQQDLLRVWAPQTIYDPEAGKYMVYWSMKHGDGPDIIYYAYANADFTGFEQAPKPLFLPKEGRPCIDGDIILKDGVYHLFYKTEGHGNGIKVATSTSLTSGQWREQSGYKQQTTDAVEGSCVFKLINSDTYILLYDVYMKGKYQFTKSTDLQHFEVIDEAVSMDFKPRHGTVMPISADELKRLTDRWGQVQEFPLQDVRLLEGPFKQAQDRNKAYLLELDADRLLAPFLREAGLTPKAESYGNWENTGLDGHIGGHYLSALSLMYAATGDEEVKERLDYLLAELKRCQDHLGTGYIGGVPGGVALWEEIKAGRIAAGGFDLNKKWVPLYNIHKTYAGLRDAYLIVGHQGARKMLIRMTDWAVQLVSNLSDGQVQDMLRSEHGGLNEVFADVAAITGDERYLTLAKRFSHRTILEPLLNREDRLTGLHANTQIPKVIGYKRIADVEGNPPWSEAARFFWETVVQRRSVSIGGNSAYEHFHPANDFSRMIRGVEGPETCNTYNMLKLTEQLFQTEPLVRYADFYERALFNHILSTQHPRTGGFVYFTPMRPGHYRVYSQAQTSFWCCVGSGLENHAKYGAFIYAHSNDALYVNLFIASQLNWESKGVAVTQQTNFPEEAGTTLSINPTQPTVFTLNLRYPTWVKESEFSIAVNGARYPVDEKPGAFVSITREWKAGDEIRVQFAMHTTVEQLPDSSNYYSFLYGPIVLAAKMDTMDMVGRFADDSRGGHIAHGQQVPLREVPIVVGEQEALASLPRHVVGKPLHFALDNLYATKSEGPMELMPFFQLHDSRYILYWPQATPDEAAALQQQMDAEERESVQLDALTIDKVSGGQQQPESDHAIQFEASTTGQYEGEQWREANGWFSYQFKNTGKVAKYLFVRYCDIDRPSHFDVLVNGQLITTTRLEGRRTGTGFITANYPLPAGIGNADRLTVRFRAREGSITAKLVEARLLKAAIH